MPRIATTVCLAAVALAAAACGAAPGMMTGSLRPPAQGVSSQSGTTTAQMLASVNSYRAAHGLRPVRIDAAVMRAARAQSQAMAQLGTMSHDAGGDFRSRLLANGVGRAPAVENIAWGQRSFAEAMQSWQYSASHAQNMQTPDMTRLGIAVVNGASGPFWTLVMAGDAR